MTSKVDFKSPSNFKKITFRCAFYGLATYSQNTETSPKVKFLLSEGLACERMFLLCSSGPDTIIIELSSKIKTKVILTANQKEGKDPQEPMKTQGKRKPTKLTWAR